MSRRKLKQLFSITTFMNSSYSKYVDWKLVGKVTPVVNQVSVTPGAA